MLYRGRPVRKMYWVVEYWKDNKSPNILISQVGEKGDILQWEDMPRPPDGYRMASIEFIPFTEEMAKKVHEADKQIACLPAAWHRFKVVAQPGEEIIAKRREKQHITKSVLCDHCKCNFLWFSEKRLSNCPKCGMGDEWYCPECKKIKTEIKKLPNGEVLCTDCETVGKKVGLSLVEHLTLRGELFYTSEYILLIKDKCAMIVSDDGVEMNTSDRSIFQPFPELNCEKN